MKHRNLSWKFFDLPTTYGAGVWDANWVGGVFEVYVISDEKHPEPAYYVRILAATYETLEAAQAACQRHADAAVTVWSEQSSSEQSSSFLEAIEDVLIFWAMGWDKDSPAAMQDKMNDLAREYQNAKGGKLHS